MKTILFVALFGVAFRPAYTGDLESALERILSETGYTGGRAAVAVLDTEGRPQAWIEATKPLKPASNIKILTTVAALEILGPDYEFVTRIYTRAPLKDGKIDGDVIVHGTGDPNISGRFYGGDPLALFRTWARGLKAKGLRRIEGRILADDSYFDSVRFLPDWNPQEAGRWYCAEVSPLVLNDNCVDVTITPTRPGSPARIDAVPRPRIIEIQGGARTVSGRVLELIVHRLRDRNVLRVRGRIGALRPPWTCNVAVHDPALFFVHTLHEVFEKEGIEITGEPGRLSEARGEDADDGDRVQVLVRHTSPLKIALPVVNKRSQNLHAEILLKSVGKRAFGEGSTAQGVRAVKEALKKLGVAPPPALDMRDGSGLAHSNRATAGLLATVLHRVRSRPYFELFRDSLAVAGVDGTLERRFRRRPHLRGKVRGKTGTLRGVSSLSGYVEGEEGTWSFSILINGGPPKGPPPREVEEILVERIARELERAD